jgi:phage baseplate assembly protein W
MAYILGSGVAFPLQVDRRGGIALASDETDVDQAIQLILSTAPGERPMRPEFGCGVHDFVFDTIDAATAGRLETEVRRALDRWEPRIDVVSVDMSVEPGPGGGMVDELVVIEITYRLRATNDVRNLVHPFYVIPAEESTP